MMARTSIYILVKPAICTLKEEGVLNSTYLSPILVNFLANSVIQDFTKPNLGIHDLILNSLASDHKKNEGTKNRIVVKYQELRSQFKLHTTTHQPMNTQYKLTFKLAKSSYNASP